MYFKLVISAVNLEEYNYIILFPYSLVFKLKIYIIQIWKIDLFKTFFHILQKINHKNLNLLLFLSRNKLTTDNQRKESHDI